MEITVSARNTEVSSALREAVEEKIGRLSRKASGLRRADVHFFEERNPRIAEREICEVTIDGRGDPAASSPGGASSNAVDGGATSRLFGTAAGADYWFSAHTLAGFALAGGGTNFSVTNRGKGRSALFQAEAFMRHHRSSGDAPRERRTPGSYADKGVVRCVW